MSWKEKDKQDEGKVGGAVIQYNLKCVLNTEKGSCSLWFMQCKKAMVNLQVEYRPGNLTRQSPSTVPTHH